MPISVLLADDHPVVRVGLRSLLQAERDFRLLGEVADGLQVLPQVEQLRPHVLVLDLMMPGLSGLEIIRQAGRRVPHTRIVVLSMYANEAYVMEALREGALGYVLKGSHATEVVHAVREAAAGRRYLSPPLSEHAIEAYAQRAQNPTLDLYETLTTREREVLHLAAEGCTSTEIAKRLFISPRTVETHRANLMRKIGVATQTDLVRFALRRGILPMDD
jgi:two-component system, NarL family, response regulator NreC